MTFAWCGTGVLPSAPPDAGSADRDAVAGARRSPRPGIGRLGTRRPSSRRRARRPRTGILGVVDGELRGWIVNFDNPRRAETIWCVGRSGRSLPVRPTHRRDDAALAYGVPDIRGFAVPVDLLDALGPVVSVRNDRGQTLGGGSDVAVAGAGRAKSTSGGPHRQCLFLHIPKTAGTSLRDALLRTVPQGEALLVYPDWELGVTYEECVALPAAQLARFRWIYGHYKTGLHRYTASGARYVTFVREPLARLRSNVAHHAAAGTRFAVDGVGVRPSEFINGGLGEEFDNLMTRMISGVPPCADGPGAIGPAHVDLAIDNIREHFAFVGRQEHLVHDALSLQRHVGLDLATPGLSNITPSRRLYEPTETAAIDWQTIARRNRFDILLHDRIVAMGLTSRALSRAEPPP